MLRLILAAIAVSLLTVSVCGRETAGPGLTVMPENPFRIVGFGNSLMAGYRLENNQSFPAVLEKALREKGYDVVVDNAGVSGDTTTGGLARIDWSVPDDTGLVILELGASDMLRAISPELTERNLEAMLVRLKERRIPVILARMLSAPNMGQQQEKKFNAIYPRLARKFDIPFYPFFLDSIMAKRQMLLDDGMHPNKNGVQIMVECFLPAVEKVLGTLGVKSSLSTN